MLETETNFYSLDIGQHYYDDEDLVIKVIPENYDIDPDIYISKVT